MVDVSISRSTFRVNLFDYDRENKIPGIREYRWPITKLFMKIIGKAIVVDAGGKKLCVNRKSFDNWLKRHSVDSKDHNQAVASWVDFAIQGAKEFVEGKIAAEQNRWYNAPIRGKLKNLEVAKQYIDSTPKDTLYADAFVAVYQNIQMTLGINPNISRREFRDEIFHSIDVSEAMTDDAKGAAKQAFLKAYRFPEI